VPPSAGDHAGGSAEPGDATGARLKEVFVLEVEDGFAKDLRRRPRDGDERVVLPGLRRRERQRSEPPPSGVH